MHHFSSEVLIISAISDSWSWTRMFTNSNHCASGTFSLLVLNVCKSIIRIMCAAWKVQCLSWGIVIYLHWHYRYHQRILHISYKDHVTNWEVCSMWSMDHNEPYPDLHQYMANTLTVEDTKREKDLHQYGKFLLQVMAVGETVGELPINTWKTVYWRLYERGCV